MRYSLEGVRRSTEQTSLILRVKSHEVGIDFSNLRGASSKAPEEIRSLKGLSEKGIEDEGGEEKMIT